MEDEQTIAVPLEDYWQMEDFSPFSPPPSSPSPPTSLQQILDNLSDLARMAKIRTAQVEKLGVLENPGSHVNDVFVGLLNFLQLVRRVAKERSNFNDRHLSLEDDILIYKASRLAFEAQANYFESIANQASILRQHHTISKEMVDALEEIGVKNDIIHRGCPPYSTQVASDVAVAAAAAAAIIIASTAESTGEDKGTEYYFASMLSMAIAALRLNH